MTPQRLRVGPVAAMLRAMSVSLPIEFNAAGLPAVPADELAAQLKPSAAERFMTSYRGYANEWNVANDQITALEGSGQAVPAELRQRAGALSDKAKYWGDVAWSLVQRLDDAAAQRALVAR